MSSHELEADEQAMVELARSTEAIRGHWGGVLEAVLLFPDSPEDLALFLVENVNRD
jgi:hypothetical protein